jgi:polyisoprenoid-binding protein YceI
MNLRILDHAPLRPTFALIASLAIAAGCSGRDADSGDKPEKEPKEQAEATDQPDEDEAAAADAPDEVSDGIRIFANHVPAQESDPVVVEFQRYEIVRAEFDPSDLEGGEAELSIDLASLKTDNEQRDAHLRSDDYLHVEEHPTATVIIGDVERVADDRYRASFEVTVHGVQVSWPIELEVLGREGSRIRVRGEHTFDRIEFDVGMEEVGEDGDGVAREMRLEAILTVSPTA